MSVKFSVCSKRHTGAKTAAEGKLPLDLCRKGVYASYTLSQLNNMIEELLVQKVDGLSKQTSKYRDLRAGVNRYSLADITMLMELLGYESSYRFGAGLEEAMDWYEIC